MQDFEALKKIWQQKPELVKRVSGPKELSSTSKRNKKLLQYAQLVGGTGQVIVSAFISWMMVFGNFGFRFWYTYLSMGMVVLLCLLQAGYMLYTYTKIRAIDDSLPPAEHLRQWEQYYALRQQQITFQGPVFTVLLSIALGIYYIEILSGRPFLPVLLVVLVTIAWILFAYFYLGKKSIRKETNRLQSIIYELQAVERQLEEEEPSGLDQ